MKAVQLILASKSPRRLALLKQIGWEAEVQTGFFPEATDLVKLADRLHHEPGALGHLAGGGGRVVEGAGFLVSW